MGKRDYTLISGGQIYNLFVLFLGYMVSIFAPKGEFLRGVKGRGKHYHLDVSRKKHDCFLPYLSSVWVIDIMDFVKYDTTEFGFQVDLEVNEGFCGGGFGLVVERVLKDFGSHNEDIGFWVGFDISRENAEGNVWELFGEFVELLIGKSFDGRSIDDFFLESFDKVFNGEFGWECFSRTSMRGYKDVISFDDGLNCVLLETA
jgi:hypothetical protein